MTNTPNRTAQTQSGFVSIIVTMIIMVLLSLIVIGFAKISRREQRQGLDRQLASQAQYAAESGINDAQAYLKAGKALTSTANTACNSYADSTQVPVVYDGPTATTGLPKSSTISDNVVTSCVLVDSNLTELRYDSVDEASEVVVPVQLKSGAGITSIRISWQGSGGTGDYANCPAGSTSLPKSADWTCPAGVLRADITPNILDRNSLITNAKGMLFVPQRAGSGTSTATFGGSGVSTVLSGVTCSGVSATSPMKCSVTVTVNGNSKYYLRIRPVYKTVDISIAANPQVSGVGSVLTGAQVLIDSTGRANDVLKRLVARVPSCVSGCGRQPAGFALQTSDSICKRYVYSVSQSILENDSPGDPSCDLP